MKDKKEFEKPCKHDWFEHETNVILATKKGRYIVSVRICRECNKLQVRSGKITNGIWRPK